MSAQKNSFVTIAEQIQLLNNNAVEIMNRAKIVGDTSESAIDSTKKVYSEREILILKSIEEGKVVDEIGTDDYDIKLHWEQIKECKE